MKTRLSTAFITLMFAGNALAADGFRIESEAQFVRDYGDQIEQVGPGVYQVVKGNLAGKTISIGEAGLEYDLHIQRAMIEKAIKADRDVSKQQSMIQPLESIQQHYSQLHALSTGNISAMRSSYGSFPCVYRPIGGANPTYYSGFANVSATAELYLSDGGGGLNLYYARASAAASGSVNPPYQVPASLSISVSAYATNRLTGQTVTRQASGTYSAGTSTGYVGSGPSFGHDLYASAIVNGIGNCYGYVSISDTLQIW